MNRISVAEVEPGRPRVALPAARTRRASGRGLLSSLVAALLCSATAPAVAQSASSLSPLDTWRRDLPGIRTTEGQFGADDAGAAPHEHRQRLLIRLLQPTAAMPGLHVYVERGRLGQLQRPLSQEVWRVSGVGARVKVERFRLKVPARFLGARSSDGLLGRIVLEDLEPLKGCDVVFDLRDGRWDGATVGRACRAHPSAAYSLQRITWDAARVTLDERQFAADGRELAGPPNSVPYDFAPERPLESTR